MRNSQVEIKPLAANCGATIHGIDLNLATDEDLDKVRKALPDTPILIGSGTSAENCSGLLAIADGVIVASSLKRKGDVQNPIDVEKVRQLVKAIQG